MEKYLLRVNAEASAGTSEKCLRAVEEPQMCETIGTFRRTDSLIPTAMF